jgi:hypothetical protein
MMMSSDPSPVPRKVLHVTWQRLVDGTDATCPRCRDTETHLDDAVAFLRPLLAGQGIEILLQKKRIPPLFFKRHPLASNVISIEGKHLESWLQAETGRSPCCDICGDNECRTLTLEGKTCEAVPVDLIVRGILKAVETIFGVKTGT